MEQKTTAMPAYDVALFGEMMVLLVAAGPGSLASVGTFHKMTAGAETNVGIALSRLGSNVAWASRLGDDTMGLYLKNVMQAEGIDCSMVRMMPRQRTGFMLKGKVEQGDPPIEYYRSGSAASAMTAADLDTDWLDRARHLHVTGIFPALNDGTFELTVAAMRHMRKAGKTISFDPNLRPALWPSADAMREKLNRLAALADWVLPGEEEGRLLTGAQTVQGIAAFYQGLGATAVVVKLGAQGAFAQADSVAFTVQGFPVSKVVDTVGAGDGFAAGLISARLEGMDWPAAVRRATILGACAVQVAGDTEGYPDRDTLLRLEAGARA